MTMHHVYKGFRALILPEMESTESRLARGDWRFQVVGYRYTARYRGRVSFCVDSPLPTVDDAITDFQNRIDAILDSL
ncbi:hypothetical protein [Nostoc sp. ChiSLP03a]|uniref:hypothetical protein n=1 Tax=Nostoc sp. ChiSLP03a TaxID=3075380 RepID=UPI002AD4D122|nr:hypothetical protein [Nostoc sp. ChiSLP03a]MDZ8211620.1 hypothetical protein [Nostoc sp. ChiSLP03a]